MNFTLITRNGKVLTFYIEAVARTYQQAYGGVLMQVQKFGEMEIPVTI